MPDHPNLVRLGIDGALAAVGVAPNGAQGQAARALPGLRRVSASVDHVERRTSDVLKRQPSLDANHAADNADDLADAERQADVLRAAARAAEHLIADMARQVGAPVPDFADPRLAAETARADAAEAEVARLIEAAAANKPPAKPKG